MSNLTAVLALDGTPSSEDALRLVPFLREMGIDELRLVGVWQSPDGSGKGGEEKAAAHIADYLRERASGLAAAGDKELRVETSVRHGRPADQIVAEEVACRADLLVLATHGRAGADRWRLGSVADEVVRRAAVPVLLAGPNMSVNLTHYRGRHIMVPLDGLPLSEQALPAAKAIADRTGASVSLVRVVTLVTSWALSFQDDPQHILEGMEAAAEAEMDKLASQHGYSSDVLRAGFSGNVANELVRYIASHAIDLVVMTSHTRASLERWLIGSVADELLRGPAPVLLVKPGEVHSSRLLRPSTDH